MIDRTNIEAPKGKRTVRRNIYGNLHGYIAGRYWVPLGDAFFSPDVERAEAWARGEIEIN